MPNARSTRTIAVIRKSDVEYVYFSTARTSRDPFEKRCSCNDASCLYDYPSVCYDEARKIIGPLPKDRVVRFRVTRLAAQPRPKPKR
jgi:hypothetical protein